MTNRRGRVAVKPSPLPLSATTRVGCMVRAIEVCRHVTSALEEAFTRVQALWRNPSSNTAVRRTGALTSETCAPSASRAAIPSTRSPYLADIDRFSDVDGTSILTQMNAGSSSSARLTESRNSEAIRCVSNWSLVPLQYHDHA